MVLLGRGVYSFQEAAVLTHMKRARIREWFQQRPTSGKDSLFKSDFDGLTSEPLISFLDLVDVFIAGQLRDQGISLQTLRRVYQTLQHDFGVQHAFSRSELLTDGKRVFLAGLDSKARDEVIEVLTKQRAFPKIILPFLKKLDFDATSRLAMKWHIASGVVLNPQICFGQPIVEASGIPTTLLAKTMRANGNAKLVADWFGVTPQQVNLASQFEARRAV